LHLTKSERAIVIRIDCEEALLSDCDSLGFFDFAVAVAVESCKALGVLANSLGLFALLLCRFGALALSFGWAIGVSDF
jgi:hypothetical protein